MSIEQDRHILYVDGKKHIEAKRGAMDIFGADNVEVQIDYDRRKLWINVNGWCALRVHNIRGHYEYIDLRAMTDRSELYERGLVNKERIEQEQAAAGIASAELARVVRLHAERHADKK